MNQILQRIRSYLATPSQALERLDDLGVELSQRGLRFNIRPIEEDGKKYFYAESVDYPRGHISAVGSTEEELEKELKDAIFTAFEVPVRYCDPRRITITFDSRSGSSLSDMQIVTAREERYVTA
jgi:predicted RNase H-like HicB family nuclease